LKGERTPVRSLAARVRGRLRRLLDNSFRYELGWFLSGTAVLTLLLASPPWGVHYGELVVGEPAPRDVIVPLDVEIPDEAGTSALREAARRQVPPSYVFDASAALRVEHAIAEAFEAGRRLLEAAGQPGGASSSGRAPEPGRSAVMAPLPPGTPSDFVDACWRARFSPALEHDLETAARRLLSGLIVPRMDMLPVARPISVRTARERRETLLSDFSQIMDIDSARQRAQQMGAAIEGFAERDRGAARALLERLVEPTLTFDQEETARRMDEAARRVPLRFARLERGTVLARRGTPLTGEIVEQARAIEKARPQSLKPVPIAGTAMLSTLLFGFLWLYPSYQRRRREEPAHLFSMLALLILMMLLTTRGLLGVSSLLLDRLEPYDRMETMLYLIPASAGGMLAGLLFSGRVATVYSVFFSLPYAIIAGWDLRLLAYSLVTHFAAIYAASQYRSRAAVMKAGFAVGLAGAASAVAIDLASGSANNWQMVGADGGAALAGGAVGVPVLVSFFLPFCESLFGVLTDVRLLELSNLNNPLLSQLAASAPGSYNHSLIVGTLAEEAAKASGANGLFCRVAAFYHDVGKVKMPEYFIENLGGGGNPHERLAPSMSALVLASHVKEGARLAREYGLPQQIVDVIPQHHGTRVMTYFFEKAKKTAANGVHVNPDDFRYPGPKPQTREAAIFMLADSVEAAARTIDEPNAEKFRAMIRQISGRIILDGQFDECDLTFRDLDAIVEAFVRSLVSIYHHRVDYPTYVFDSEERRKKSEGLPREARR